jgi:hypothetical protein
MKELTSTIETSYEEDQTIPTDPFFIVYNQRQLVAKLRRKTLRKANNEKKRRLKMA